MLKIKKVNYDDTCFSGCETCDYGSSYINDIEIILEDDTYIHIKIDKMYEYVFNESDFMKILGTSDNLDDLYYKLFEYIREKCWHNDIAFAISLNGLYMEVNGKNVDIVSSCGRGCLVLEEDEDESKDI